MTGRGPAVRERQRAQAREEEISLLKEAIGTGSTIEEAKEQAVAILGAGPEDNIEIEVLAMPKRKTLGLFGGSPALSLIHILLYKILQNTSLTMRLWYLCRMY